jgi:hypothetical protein
MRRATCCAVLLLTSRAHAGTCPVPVGGDAALAARDASERIDFLHRAADDQARYAQRWKWGWFAVGLGTFTWSAAQVVGWAASDSLVRTANITDNVIITAFSIATPISALLFAPRIASTGPAIDELLRATANGAAGTCDVLARMEEIFSTGAADESRKGGWLAQLSSLLGVGALFSILVVEAAAASVPDVRRAHLQNAILTTVGGVVLTQSEIASTPTGAESAYKRYLRGDLQPKAVTVSLTSFQIAPGLSLRLSF